MVAPTKEGSMKKRKIHKMHGSPDFNADVDIPIPYTLSRSIVDKIKDGTFKAEGVETGRIGTGRATYVYPDAKASNPKQAMGDEKLPLHAVPDSMECFAALAFMEGGLKYGLHNYKAIGVQASTYYAACKRHMKKWWSGEWADKKTGIPHLSSALACL